MSKILAGAAETLDFGQPVAVIMMGLLHFFPDDEEPYSLPGRRYLDAPANGRAVGGADHGAFMRINPQATRHVGSRAWAAPPSRIRTVPPTQEPERGKSKRYYRMRENLVDVAAGLFSKNGYASTGVAEIGDATGLARGALYYYMGSR